ncbi:hypothetical protein [Spirosoma radiotolerans]|uniref:hypothetical protein n=1 Tax=Spirosoma radiotolerans TaxID=1379870 RepID=UPI000AACB1DD|nr:hypothetical protein [Spirosoma radiotolerans]
MNPAISIIRPALSTVVISANQHGNSRKLDELLAISQETYSCYSMDEPSSYWVSGRDVVGLDENNHLMYSLTRKESWLFSAGVIAGLTVLGFVCKLLLM